MNDLGVVQTAVYQALTATPATYPVYDAVPQGAAYPYIVIGAFSGEPDDELGATSTDAALMIHVWSRSPGKAQTHTIAEFIRARLDHIAIGGGAWSVYEDFSEIMEDIASTASSRLYHAAIRYRVRVG